MNNIWGNTNKEINDAGSYIKARRIKAQYNDIKQKANNAENTEYPNFGIGHDSNSNSYAIITTRNYQDKYDMHKARFYCCNDLSSTNVDFLKNESNHGNKLQVKYKRSDDLSYSQVLYIGDLDSANSQIDRPGILNMIPDSANSTEEYHIKMNHDDWINTIADLSYTDNINRCMYPLNNPNFTIRGPIEL